MDWSGADGLLRFVSLLAKLTVIYGRRRASQVNLIAPLAARHLSVTEQHGEHTLHMHGEVGPALPHLPRVPI